jgi:predicted Zn-dependent peptidase
MLDGYRREVLPNGLRVLGVQNPALHSFVCSVYCRVGPRFESRDQVGLSHFLEHMLMQGSEGYPSSTALMRAIEDVGGVLDAGTHPEYIHIYFGVHRKHWRRVVDIAADVVVRPLFDPIEIAQEKLIIAQELMQHREAGGRIISAAELADGLLMLERPDEAGSRGTPGIMEAFDRAMVAEQYRRHYVPRNMVVCLSGGFDFDEVLADLSEKFSAMPDGPVPDVHPAGMLRRRRALYRRTEVLPQVELLLCHPSVGLGDPAHEATRAVANLLGGGLSSRLFAWVRENCGLVYDIESYLEAYADCGALEIGLSAGTENVAPALEAVLEVLDRTRQEGFTPEELARQKEGACCGVEMLCDSATRLADWFGRQELLVGAEATVTPQTYVERQQALTLDDLSSALAQATGDDAVLVAVGPHGEGDCDRLRELFPAEEVEPAAAEA